MEGRQSANGRWALHAQPRADSLVVVIFLALDFVIPDVLRGLDIEVGCWGRLVQLAENLGHLVEVVLLLLDLELVRLGQDGKGVSAARTGSK